VQKKEIKEKQNDTVRNIISATTGQEVVDRFGRAASEYVKSYNGWDPNKESLFRGLKQISQSRIDSNYEYQNIKQQAGFSAEVVHVSRGNAERIINNKLSRLARTEDLGLVNDPQTDILELNSKGQIIPGSESQMKFKGRFSTPREIKQSVKQNINILVNNKYYHKYSKQKILIPGEQYSLLKEMTSQEAQKLKIKASAFRKEGLEKKAQLLENRAARLEDVNNRVKKSHLTSREAIYVRLLPKRFTAKEILSTSHKAGLIQLQNAAIIGSSISLIQNMSAYYKHEKELKGALKSISKNTLNSALMGYVTGGAGTTIKALCENSHKAILKNVSKSNLPAIIAVSVVELTKSVRSLILGNIDGIQFLEEIGEKGSGLAASSMGAAIGQVLLPVPVVGALVGSMVGYSMSSIFYQQTLYALKEERLSKARRANIEYYCESAIKYMDKYEAYLKNVFRSRAIKDNKTIRLFFQEFEQAIQKNDIEMFTASVCDLALHFGHVLQFQTLEEFNWFMLSDEPLKL